MRWRDEQEQSIHPSLKASPYSRSRGHLGGTGSLQLHGEKKAMRMGGDASSVTERASEGDPGSKLLVLVGGCFASLFLGVSIFLTLAGTDYVTLLFWWGVAGVFTFTFVMMAIGFFFLRQREVAGRSEDRPSP
jgi:hypothetical protein